MSALAFVDTPDAVAAARARGAGRVVTDNPRLAAVAGIENIEALIDQDAANRIGAAAIGLALAVDEAIAAGDLALRAGLAGHRPRLAGTLSRFAGGLLHRAAALARALEGEADTPLAILVVAAPDAAEGDPLAPGRFHCPHVELAPAGFFGARRVSVERVGQAPAAAALAEVPRSLARRLAPLPGAVVVHAVAERLGLGRLRRGPVLVLGHEVEALRETLPYLARAGFRLRRAGALAAPIPTDAPPSPALAESVAGALAAPIERALAAPIERALAAAGAFAAEQRRALAAVLLARIGRALAGLALAWPEQRRRVQRVFAGAAPVFLTGGLFGPRGAMLKDALAERGIAVIDVEHGVTTGLSAHSQRKIDFSEAATADAMLVCAANAAAAFGAARAAPARRHAIGLADQTRRLFRPALQRRLARRALGLGGRESVLLHVGTWLHSGNMRPGVFTPTEAAVLEHERALVERVYAGIPHRVVYKPYPAQRFAFQPGAAELFATPANLVHAPPEDLRYMRAAADAIVTAAPTSTLGWVLGAGVPVIWLDSARINPLIDETWRARFREAFPTVDLDRDDWAEALRALVSRPLPSLQRDWADRRAPRAALLEEAVFGPPGHVGRRAAGIVAAFVAERRRAVPAEAAAAPPALGRAEPAERR